MLDPAQQRERAYLMKLWREGFRDLEWGFVKREAFRYVFQNETLDGFDDHLRELFPRPNRGGKP